MKFLFFSIRPSYELSCRDESNRNKTRRGGQWPDHRGCDEKNPVIAEESPNLETDSHFGLRMKTIRAVARNLSVLSSSRPRPLVLNIPKANIYRFGDGDSAKPVFSSLDWKIEQGQSWAIVGFGAKQSLIEVVNSSKNI
jgi:hypothetical protein